MKITIAYQPEEAQVANMLKHTICSILDSTKVKESDRHAPFKHTYITTGKPEKP